MRWFIADSMNTLSPKKEYFISRRIYTSTDVFLEELRPFAYKRYRFREFRLPNEEDFIYKGAPGFRTGEPCKRFIIDCNDTERELLQLMADDFTYFTYIAASSRSMYIKDVVDKFFGVEEE